MKQLPSMEARFHRPSSCPPSSTNSSILQSWAHTSSRETQIVTRKTKRNHWRWHEHLPRIFNLSVTTCQIPAIWKSSLIIPIAKPGKNTFHGTSYRPISLPCPDAKVLESLLLPTINKYILPAPDQHGFRPEQSTTSALVQLTTDLAMGFNRRKP